MIAWVCKVKVVVTVWSLCDLGSLFPSLGYLLGLFQIFFKASSRSSISDYVIISGPAYQGNHGNCSWLGAREDEVREGGHPGEDLGNSELVLEGKKRTSSTSLTKGSPELSLTNGRPLYARV